MKDHARALATRLGLPTLILASLLYTGPVFAQVSLAIAAGGGQDAANRAFGFIAECELDSACTGSTGGPATGHLLVQTCTAPGCGLSHAEVRCLRVVGDQALFEARVSESGAGDLPPGSVVTSIVRAGGSPLADVGAGTAGFLLEAGNAVEAEPCAQPFIEPPPVMSGSITVLSRDRLDRP